MIGMFLPGTPLHCTFPDSGVEEVITGQRLADDSSVSTRNPGDVMDAAPGFSDWP